MYYLTKYALTKGIITQERDKKNQPFCNGAIYEHDGRKYVRSSGALFLLGKDAFETLPEAQADCVKRAKSKIKSIVKLEAKLNALITEWEKDLP